MTEALTPRLLGKLARAALDNASDLLSDAEVLLKEGRYPRALALTVLAAEEFGKHMMCMSAVGLDLADESEVKKFWKRFRSHAAKYQNWHGQLIDYIAINPEEPWNPEGTGPDLWDEMWQDMPKIVEFAMDQKMSALYVDARNGEPTSPSDLASADLVPNVWESVSLIVKRFGSLWDGADLAEHLERTAPRMQKLREVMVKAKEKSDPSDAVEVFRDLFGLSEGEMARLSRSFTPLQSEEE